MNRDIALYIGGQKVEWSKVPDILLTYQRTDYQNPTVTKNMFSKTITIDGTQNNNDIFNHIWNLSRVMDDGYMLFNPSQRVEFELFDNAEIVEKGYCKLDSIKRDGYKIAYNITLYGGLGSFFYNLAYDIDTDKEKTLSDLNYTNSPNPDDEFDFEINKYAIKDAWDALQHYGSNTGDKRKYDYFNFMTAYNGLPDGLDADKVLINTNDATGLSVRYTDDNGLHYGTFPTTITSENTAYTPYNGYVYGEMRRECNEWEMRDLRSYLQKPCLSVRGFFDAIKNPINNGGYNVVLDNEFFSDDNPYYSKAWITLPMLDSSSITDDSIDEWDFYSGEYETEYRPRFLYVKINNIDPFGDTPDILRFKCEIHTTFTGATANTLYTTCIFHSSGFNTDGAPVGDYEAVNSTAIQFYINKNGNLGTEYADDIASSNRIILSSRLPSGQFWDGGASWNSMPLANHTKQVSIGVWKKVSGNDYVWEMEDGTREFNIELETNHINTIPLIGFMSKSVCRHDLERCGQAYDGQYYASRSEMNSHSFSHLFGERPVNLDSEIVYRGGYTIRSNQKMKKKNLLGGMEGTPCDWLLSYCKLFGLFISKDKVNDTIYIQMRKNWYKREIVDLDNLIDRSKDIDITPLTFESKWYNFNYGEAEGKFLNKYKDAYSQDFGKQLINTQYNFDADEIDLLEDNLFINGLTCLEKGNYYNIKKDVKNFTVFPCLYDWCTVTYYFNGETTDIYMALPAGTVTTGMNPNTPDEFYDFLPKMQFCDSDNGNVEGNGVLVFFNGLKNTGDIDYWITDDIEEMFDNSDNACWLQTMSEYNSSGDERIAIRANMLPSFSRYMEYHNVITSDWDFGYTKELYVPYYRFDVNRTPTMYQNFWEAYIKDLYDVDTRNVDCYVALNSNDVYEFMKKFYWWDNSYWVCTKVQDFDIALDKSTKCSFTKVNDIEAYFDTPTFDDRFFNFYYNGATIPAQGTDEERSFEFILDCSSNWIVTNTGEGFASYYPDAQTSGTYVVGQVIRCKYEPNYSPAPRYCLYIADNTEGEQRMIRVWQEGYKKEKYLTVTPTSIILQKEVQNGTQVTVSSSSSWFLMAPLWIVIPPHSTSSGDTTLTISAETNTTGAERTGQVTFNNDDGLQAILTVKQKSNAKVTLEQLVIPPSQPVYTVPASGGNVFYKIVNDIECTVEPLGNTENYAIASGLVSYHTTIQPSNGTNFWIHFNPNNSTVSRNAAFYGSYVEDGGRYTVMPTIVPLPLQQLASGNTIVELQSKSYTTATTLGASYRWTATTNNNWITLTTSSGSSSDSSVQYTVSQNTGHFRKGYIYINYVDEMGYYCQEVIEIHQEGVDVPVVVTPSAITVSDRGGDYTINVESPSSYTISSVDSKMSVTSESYDSFTIHIEPNEGYEKTIYADVVTNGGTYRVNINQLSSYPNNYVLDYAPQDIVFESSGGTIQITIRSDSDWTIE